MATIDQFQGMDPYDIFETTGIGWPEFAIEIDAAGQDKVALNVQANEIAASITQLPVTFIDIVQLIKLGFVYPNFGNYSAFLIHEYIGVLKNPLLEMQAVRAILQRAPDGSIMKRNAIIDLQITGIEYLTSQGLDYANSQFSEQGSVLITDAFIDNIFEQSLDEFPISNPINQLLFE